METKSTFMLTIILDDLARLPALLAAWKEFDIGSTLVDSQGGYRVSSWLDRVGLGGLNRLLQGQAVHDQRVLFSIVQGEEQLEKAITAAERVLEGFDRPDGGVLFVTPVVRALGLGKGGGQKPKSKQRTVEAADRIGIGLGTRVSEIVDILDLKPCVVHRNDPIEEVVKAILAHPSVNVVGVLSEEGRLVGLIDMALLSESLFYHIFPEPFLAELHDLEDVKEFIRRPHGGTTAGEIMKEAEFVHLDDTLLTAFKVLQRRKLEGIPVVDESNRPTGYIHLIELMEASIHSLQTGRKEAP